MQSASQPRVAQTPSTVCSVGDGIDGSSPVRPTVRSDEQPSPACLSKLGLLIPLSPLPPEPSFPLFASTELTSREHQLTAPGPSECDHGKRRDNPCSAESRHDATSRFPAGSSQWAVVGVLLSDTPLYWVRGRASQKDSNSQLSSLAWSQPSHPCSAGALFPAA